MFQYRQVLTRIRAGQTDRQIARARLMGRVKVAAFRALAAAQGWLDPDVALPDDAALAAAIGAARRARSTISSAEPYRTQIERWIADGISGTVIHAALCREHGYTGSYSAVYRLMRSIRRAAPADVTVPLSFAPGEAAQVDFGAGPLLAHPVSGALKRTWCFVMTLCFSRHQYVEFVWDQSAPTWLGCHRRAFEWFGCVPERVIIDNAKCAITRACYHDPLVQRSYAECAEGYGFLIDPCPPHDPQKKGIVEAGVKYVKRNFLALRVFRDLADLNRQAGRWVREEAGLRIHGTTRERPLDRFVIEKPLMRALPAIAPDLGAWTRVRVHRDCHVQYARALYSVPFALVGQELWLRATDTTITIYQDYRAVASHVRRPAAQRSTVPDHLPPSAQAFFARDRRWCLARAAAIGPAAGALIEELLSDRITERLRAAQGILRLAERFGAERLEAACARALAHASASYRTVKTILKHGLDSAPATAVDGPTAYVPQARFARQARTLFHPDAEPRSAPPFIPNPGELTDESVT